MATAATAALLGLECTVYMGAEDMKRQRLNVIRMEMLGAKVVPALSGQRTLKEAVDEALAAWIANPDTFYVLGSAAGPHPYPTMVRHFQAVIGCEAREQMLADEMQGNCLRPLSPVWAAAPMPSACSPDLWTMRTCVLSVWSPPDAA